MNRLIIYVTLFVVVSIHGYSQNDSTLMSAPDMKDDFEIYKTVLQESHAGLYRYIDPAILEKQFNAIEKAIEKPMPKNEFYLLLLKNIASLQHGHSFLVNDQKYGVNYMLRDLIPDQAYLPFTLKIIENKAYIAVDCTSRENLKSGAQIISINGISMDSLLYNFQQYISADGGNINYKNFRLEKFGFHFLYKLLYPSASSFQIECRTAERKTITIKVDGIKPGELEAKYKLITGKSVSYFAPSLEYRLLDNERSTAYLKVSSFYQGLTNRNGVEFTKFIDSTFKQIAVQKINKLILDLRDNEGGDDSLAILLFSYFTQKPFNQGNPTYIKSDRLSTLKYMDAPEEEIIQFSLHPELFLDRIGNEFILKKEFDELSFLTFPPKQPVFDGKLIILTNGGSFSATSRFINTVDFYIHGDSKRVCFVGENYGGNDGSGYATGGQSINVLLPNSHFRLSIPIKEFTRFKAGKGESAIVLDKKIGMDLKRILEDTQLQRTIEYSIKF